MIGPTVADGAKAPKRWCLLSAALRESSFRLARDWPGGGILDKSFKFTSILGNGRIAVCLFKHPTWIFGSHMQTNDICFANKSDGKRDDRSGIKAVENIHLDDNSSTQVPLSNCRPAED